MNVQRVLESVPQRTVGRAWRIRWFLPPLLAAVWLLCLFQFGSTEALRWAGVHAREGALLLLAAGALYVLPGLALLQVLWPERDLALAERLTLACGVSLALPPLLLQFAHLLRLPWNNAATIGYVGSAALTLVVLTSVQWKRQRYLPRQGQLLTWQGLVLAGLLGVALLAQMFVIRDLPVGMWGDSYHHTMISQLLVDNGGLFSSWEPYAPLTTFTYHYGFHANVAFFHWLTGVPVTQSVLIVGQLINVAALAGAYLLTSRLSGIRSAGLWAVALTGFVNMLPAFYVNWGRYTQLTGQAVLPALIVCWMAVLGTKPLPIRLSILTIIATASLMLTHYVVTIFAVLFLGAYVLILIVRFPQRHNILATLVRAIAIAGMSLVLASPWLINTLHGYLARNVASFVNPKDNAQYVASLTSLQPLTPFFLNGPIILLAVLGTVVALARRNWYVVLFAIWSLALFFSMMPQVFGLPAAGLITNFAVYIAMYLTVIPLAAYTLGLVVGIIIAWRRHIGFTFATLGFVAVSVWGLRWQQQLIAPEHMLFTSADAKAMDWIEANLPADARFLVDMFPAYDDSLFVGSDAGWWIPLLTGRQTTLPPITYGSERADTIDFSQRINDFAWAIRKHPLPSDEGVRLLREAGIGYVYSGAHDDPQRTIDAAALRQHPTFHVVYDRDNVVIFALQP